MATVKASAVIEKFWYAYNNKWGYIMNTAGELWTQAKQNATTIENAKLYGQQWVGHYVSDCSGLFYWAYKQLGGYMYHGSNTMWDKYCTSKGKLSSGKRTDGKELKPGTAVFVLKGTSNRSHVGLYVGDGNVIEASGTKVGVVITKITNSKWCEWGELKNTIYDVSFSVSTPAPSGGDKPVSTGKTATVNAKKVALRSAPSTNASVILRVDEGQKVELVENTEWTQVKYNGKTGYMMTKFLNK